MQHVEDRMRKVELDEIEGWLAVGFETSYDALLMTLLVRSTPSTMPRQLRQPLHLTPPGQVTVPTDPNFSTSTVSSEPKPEHFTDLFAYEFVQASLKVLERITGNILWLNPDLGFCLSTTLVLLWILLRCRK
jgi:hypothetical protein